MILDTIEPVRTREQEMAEALRVARLLPKNLEEAARYEAYQPIAETFLDIAAEGARTVLRHVEAARKGAK